MSDSHRPSTDIVNALTIDVEEYFHANAMDGVVSVTDWDNLPPRVERNTMRILESLDRCGVRATFFVLGWVAERWPHLVDEIDRCGHEIACHGYAHRLVYRQDRQQFHADVARAKGLLEDRLGAPVCGFRAPSYSIVEATLWALDVLIEEGFHYDCSIFPIRHDVYGIPRFDRFVTRVRRTAGEIFEVPASTVRFLGRNWPVAGGGYFRLLPYAVTRRAIEHLNTGEGKPAVVYLHPWEIDAAQPRLPAGALARFRHYANLDATEGRLLRLLRDFRFAPIHEALPELGLSSTAADERTDKRAVVR